MEVYCRGFNLYGQLNYPSHLVSKFEKTFKRDKFKTLSHTFSIVDTCNESVEVVSSVLPKSVEKNLNNAGTIIQISCNTTLILILNDKNEIFKIKIDTPEKIEQLPKFTEEYDIIEYISAGETLCVAYTKSGKLYSIPQQLEFKNNRIVDIKTGKEHCLLLDTNGDIFSFGRGSRGQLGHGSLEDEVNPRLIEALSGIKILQIAAGGWHSLALSAGGDIYTWGWNSNGQLGLASKENSDSVQVMATPTLVELDNNFIKIACGSRHSLALSDKNMLYGCGWNKYKQLSEENHENYYFLVPLHDFGKENICDIKCGPWNSAVICSK